VRILFVCLGNICRSPTAEAVMRRMVVERGLEGQIETDSAGTGDWHVGSAPDRRSTAAASRRSIVLDGAARQVIATDFDDFDLIVAMDRENAADLLALAPDDSAAQKVRLLRDFDPSGVGAGSLDVPDPYHGGERGFDEVLDIVEAACSGLLDDVVS
jgi:protein-tyrosine phosphatase